MSTGCGCGPEVVVTADAWRGASRGFKRAVVGRALGTQDSATIDAGVSHFDQAFALAEPRPTGATGDVASSAVSLLAVLGGAALGVAATLLYQSARTGALTDAQYERRVDNAEQDWRRYGVRYATVYDIPTGGG